MVYWSKMRCRHGQATRREWFYSQQVSASLVKRNFRPLQNFWLIIFCQLFCFSLLRKKFGDYLFDVCCINWKPLVEYQIPTTSYSKRITITTEKYWTSSNFFSNPNPNLTPTHLPKHQTLNPNYQFSQRIWCVEYYSAHEHMAWSQMLPKSQILLDTRISRKKICTGYRGLVLKNMVQIASVLSAIQQKQTRCKCLDRLQ